MLKKLECIVRPHKVDEIRDALEKLDVHGMTVTEVRGYGRQKGHTEVYRGAEYKVSFQPKVKLEILIRDEQAAEAIKAIQAAAKSGSFGDGKIFVVGVEEVLRIRTGERGENAL